MAKWEILDDTSKNIAGEPWSLYWKEMQSGTKEFEDFLHDPLSALIGKLSGVNVTWNVQTNMIGHEIGLSSNAVCALALVDPHRKTVFLILYKHPRD